MGKNENPELIELTNSMPAFGILRFFVNDPGNDLSKKDVIDGTGISRRQVFAIWPVLEKYKMIVKTRHYGKTKLYMLNQKSEIVKSVFAIERALINEAIMAEAEKMKIYKKV